MAENIELTEGFLPLVTEGSILGGKYDTRVPHFPENIGRFALAPSGYTGDKYSRSSKYSDFRVFNPSSDGTYYLKEGLNSKRWSLSGSEAGAGETLGSYPSFSGLTIGLGIDLGTMNKGSIERMFQTAGIGEIGKKLSEAAGVRGLEALLITKKHKDSVKLTQQQILNLQNAMWRSKESATESFIENGLTSKGKVLFPKGLIDYKKVYEPLKQVLIRCSYGSWKNLLALAERLKGIENLRGATDTQTWILQCDKFLAAMADYNQDNPPKKGRQPKFTAYGAVTMVEKIKKTLQDGGTVTINKGPVKVNDIIDPSGDLGAWMTDIYKVAKNTKTDFRQNLYNKNIQSQLNDKGFKGKDGKTLTVDGDLGTNAIHALKAFQTANNLPATGELTADTLKKLFGDGFGVTEPVEDNVVVDNTDDNPPVDNNMDDNSSAEENDDDVTTTDDNRSHNPADEEQQWLEAYKAAQVSSNTIEASVGKGGKNKPFDVIVVKAMLARAGYLPDTELQFQPVLLPIPDSLMEDAIVKFQKEIGKFTKPDGRVDPGGKTITLLNQIEVDNTNSDDNSDNNSNNSNPVENGLSDVEKQYLASYQNALTGTASISASVGKGGDNKAVDVPIIKALLVRTGYLSNTGFESNPSALIVNDATLEAAITTFQKEVCKFSKPDARVDPNGTTLGKLNGATIPQDNPVDVVDNNDDNSDNRNNNNGGGSTDETPVGDNDVVLAAGVVQLITEGNIAGGKHDTRRPHYPQNISYFKKVAAGTGNFVVIKKDIGVFQENATGDYLKGESFSPNETASVALTKGEWVLGTWLSRARIGSSGVTIGQGFDLGAKYSTGDAAKAKKRMMDADIPEKDAETLSKVVGIQGVRASIKASEIRATGMAFAQESIVKLLILSVQDYGKSLDFTNIHPALKDVLVAICYAKGNGGAKSYGVEATLNNMRGKTPEQQAAIAAAWMEGTGKMAKQAKHTRKIQQTFAAGKNIIIAPTFTLNELMDTENDLANWVSDIKGGNFQQDVAVSRAQRYLVDNNFLPNTENAVDGQWGSNTEKAVKAFQTSKQLPLTGKLDKTTLEAMFGPIGKPKTLAKTAAKTMDAAALSYGDEGGEGDNSEDLVEEVSVFTTPAITDSEFGCFH